MSGGGWRGANDFALAPDELEAGWGYISYPPTPTPTGRSLDPGVAVFPRSVSSNRNGTGRGVLPEPGWPTDVRVVAGPLSLAGPQATQSQVPAPRSTVPENVNPWRARVAMPEPPSPQIFTGQWGMPEQARSEEDSRLTRDEQKAVLKKLKKEIYNPSPKRFSRRVSLYYREQARNGASAAMRNGPDDDDDKRCAICLEDFEPREEVRVTPCDHMFHEECISPWVKSHGQCPVCRSVFCDRLRQNQSSYNNNNARTFMGNELLAQEIASMIQVVEEAIRGGRIGH
ncbi:uncharacterized protein LOC116206359 [Punica granatum]|uniref:Uncharacterized protein LOC116206359 n=1 Tax=Punica granatum TaxID=22663 RepID=A0A6P8DL02_PUNGR|nr:uncharacterized protein LOC116206359 [Punica granatum]